MLTKSPKTPGGLLFCAAPCREERKERRTEAEEGGRERGRKKGRRKDGHHPQFMRVAAPLTGSENETGSGNLILELVEYWLLAAALLSADSVASRIHANDNVIV